MKKQQSGFTLIELIMVIVVLGILAAFALPKFVNLGGDARAATVQGAYAAVKSASAMAHSSWLAKNDSSNNDISAEGVTYTLANGYPTEANIAAIAGIELATDTPPGDFVSFVPATGGVGFTHKGVAAANQVTCSVVFVEPDPAGTPATTVPAITVDVSLCE